MNQQKYVIVGAAILDILARPVDASVFETGSSPARAIAMHTGGDAMNESRVLADLGADVRLVSKVGTDPAGDLVLSACGDLHIDTSYIRRDPEIPTGVNIVLVDQEGERSFITCPDSTLRKFYPDDVPEAALAGGSILCFASIFVSPHFGNRELAALFSRARAAGLTVCADMTKRKNKETIRDMEKSLSFLDYVFPNYEEAALLTGEKDPDRIGDAFLSRGVKHVIIKAGAKGCYVCTEADRFWSPAYSRARCIDTTGAGDTFTGCFLYALGQGLPLPDCARFANAGASLCIEKTGAAGAGKDLQEIIKRAGL